LGHAAEAALQSAVLQRSDESRYNEAMAEIIPDAIRGQKYISLVTFRKNGAGVATPVWFGEEWNKLYVMTRAKSGKFKRLCGNPSVKVAPCTIRGQVTGPEFAAKARILPPLEHKRARRTINDKYWMARLPLVWARTDAYLEITFD
jgi:PPOX class probable F420-dependent enzyme